MKKSMLLMLLASGSLASHRVEALSLPDAFNAIVATVTNVIDIINSYKDKEKILKKLSNEFDRDYNPKSGMSYDEFVVQQATVYIQFVQETAKPIAAMLSIFHTICKVLSPLDVHFKLAQNAAKASYESVKALYKGSGSVKNNLTQLSKKLSGQNYTVPHSENKLIKVDIDF